MTSRVVPAEALEALLTAWTSPSGSLAEVEDAMSKARKALAEAIDPTLAVCLHCGATALWTCSPLAGLEAA